jgi:hypothetical protein
MPPKGLIRGPRADCAESKNKSCTNCRRVKAKCEAPSDDVGGAKELGDAADLQSSISLACHRCSRLKLECDRTAYPSPEEDAARMAAAHARATLKRPRHEVDEAPCGRGSSAGENRDGAAHARATSAAGCGGSSGGGSESDEEMTAASMTKAIVASFGGSVGGVPLELLRHWVKAYYFSLYYPPAWGGALSLRSSYG